MTLTPTNFRFYRKGGEWFIDLPEWEGDPAQLVMVSGTDKWLDIIAEGDLEISIRISDENFPGSYSMFQTKMSGGGMHYHVPKNLISSSTNIWLGEVARFIFGYFPEKIYFCRWF